MNPVETLSLVLGTGFSSGLNVYATVATLGILQRFGVIHPYFSSITCSASCAARCRNSPLPEFERVI